MTLDQITWLACTIIGGAFLWLLINAYRVKRGGTKTIINASESENPLEYLNATRLDNVVKAYDKTISVKIGDKLKSNVPASEYFTEFTVCKAFGINTRIIDAGSSSLVGLGLLGTFLGLTLGIMNFDSSSSDQIQSSIQVLLSGMGTAFLTSLIGMGVSLIYTLIEKTWRNGLAKALHDFNTKLDDEYYIDDVELTLYKQQQITEEATKRMVDKFQESTTELYGKIEPLLQYANSEGKVVPVSNAIREILINNEEQTKALKSFSTDLALELNNGFDESLSRQMQQRIVPLMESVDATTKAVIEHIDSMASAAANPAMDIMQQVVGDLKSSLMGIMEEFKSTLSKNATTELENLAKSLESASKAIGDFPQSMNSVSEVLQQTITEVRNSVSEISNSSASANSSAMKQMQEQIVFATTSIGEALLEVKDVMNNITTCSAQSSQELIDNVSKSSAEMNSFMKQTMEQLSGAMMASVRTMTTDLSSNQTDLLTLQKEVISNLTNSSAQSSKELIANMSKSSAQMTGFMKQTMEELSGAMLTSVNTMTTDLSGQQTNLLALQKEVINSIAESSKKSSKETIENMSRSSAEMTGYMKQTMEEVSGAMLTSVKTMTTDLSDKQIDLLALQEETTAEVKKIIGAMNEEWKHSSEVIISKTENILEKFSLSVERMNTTNTALTGTISLVQKAQADMSATSGNIQSIAKDMKSAAEQFREGQTDYSHIINQIHKETKGKLDDVLELMHTAGETSEEYAEKFETIRSGLSQIFAQIQTGLNDYSTSVRVSIQKYLDTYSASLSKTTENLAGVIQAQNDAVEMLVDTVNRKR